MSVVIVEFFLTAEPEHGSRVIQRRKLVWGPKPTLAESTRAVVAFGGL